MTEASSSSAGDTTSSTQRLSYWGRVVWDRALFPPHVPRKALHSKSFANHDACSYIFTTNNTKAQEEDESDPNNKSVSLNLEVCRDGTKPKSMEPYLLPVTRERIQVLRSKLLEQVQEKQLFQTLRRTRAPPHGGGIQTKKRKRRHGRQ